MLEASNLGFENVNLNSQTTLRLHKGLAKPPSTFLNVLFIFSIPKSKSIVSHYLDLKKNRRLTFDKIDL